MPRGLCPTAESHLLKPWEGQYYEGSQRSAAEDPRGHEALAAHLQGTPRRRSMEKEALKGVVAGTGGPELRFLVDENAARIVRWLRLMGYDTAYLPGVADGALVARARDEQRVLLTRDRGIMARREIAGGQACAMLLDSDHTWQQLEQVVRTFNLDPARAPFSRCAACNGVLEHVSPDEASAHVPPFVAATQTQFTRCPGCGRVYWRGTHWHRVSARLASLGRQGPLSSGGPEER